MEQNNRKAWLYLLPAVVFLGLFMVYPLIDVLIYSFEEGYNFASQTYFGTGTYITVHDTTRTLWANLNLAKDMKEKLLWESTQLQSVGA